MGEFDQWIREDGTRRSCVYTIRDLDFNVKYVGSADDPRKRFYVHQRHDSLIGEYIRTVYASGGSLRLEIEEWFETRHEAFSAELLYISGYHRLLGNKLLNEAIPGKGNPKRKDVITLRECIHDRCKNLMFKQGLCERHYVELMRHAWFMTQSGKEEYIKRCIESGLLMPDDPAFLTPWIIARDVSLEGTEIILNEYAKKCLPRSRTSELSRIKSTPKPKSRST